MQSYPFKLTAMGAAMSIGTAANMFVYESADASPRINMLSYTEAFDNAVWTKNAVSVTKDFAVAPDGRPVAERLVATSADSGIWQVVPCEAGAEYTGSIWLRADVPAQVEINLNSSGGQVRVPCQVTSTWQRFSVTQRVAVGATQITFVVGAWSTFSTGEEVQAYGAQVERGPNASAYVPSLTVGPAYGDGDSRIIVKPGNGNEIVLKPGQAFRLPPGETAQQWLIRAYDTDNSIDGAVIIGSGEFFDANTVHKFKLDASFANTVTVTNNASQAVPVTVQGTATVSVSNTVPVTLAGTKLTNTTAERVPVTLDDGQLLNTAESLMAYTHSNKVTNGAAAAINTVIAPGVNVNGIIGEQVMTSGASGILVAKAGAAPGNEDDGTDVLALFLGNGVPFPKRIKLAPGKGLYIKAQGGATTYVLYTVL